MVHEEQYQLEKMNMVSMISYIRKNVWKEETPSAREIDQNSPLKPQMVRTPYLQFPESQ
jgi:hypothetical protein